MNFFRYACCPHAQAESKFVNLRFHQRWTSVLSADRVRPVRIIRVPGVQAKSSTKTDAVASSLDTISESRVCDVLCRVEKRKKAGRLNDFEEPGRLLGIIER